MYDDGPAFVGVRSPSRTGIRTGEIIKRLTPDLFLERLLREVERDFFDDLPVDLGVPSISSLRALMFWNRLLRPLSETGVLSSKLVSRVLRKVATGM